MNTVRTFAGIAALLAILLLPNSVQAHCDGMDGPVVKAAQAALAAGDVDLVLIWVRKEDEEEVRAAFDRTMAVRELSDEARELADLYFFETVVRIHRIGEGAAYTGLKPAGRDLGPAIPLSDEVLETGDAGPLVHLIATEARHGLMERFERALQARDYAPGDVEAGRRYVAAYVAFIHFAEHLYQAAHHAPPGHFAEDQHSTGHEQ